MPTDTLYGLAADPFSRVAVERVFSVKDRSAERALPLVAASAAQVRRHLGELSALGERLAARFWPGPLTLVVAAPPTLAPGVASDLLRVGVRVPAHDVTRALCEACGIPLTATSANISGQPATRDADVVCASLNGRIELVIDAGWTPGGAPSTIVDVTGPRPELIRAGAISWDVVQTAAE